MKRITVSLPDELVERIKRAAGGEGQVSSYVATALADYLEREGLAEVLAAWRSETPIADDIGRQVAAELDEVGLTESATRRGRQAWLSRATNGLTLDTGALIALDRPASAILMQARLDETLRRGGSICIPAGVIAQAWRDPRQVRLARLIESRDVDIAVMTPSVARTVGGMCAGSGHADVVDVHVAFCAREREHAVVTSDPDDLARVDPALRLILV